MRWYVPSTARGHARTTEVRDERRDHCVQPVRSEQVDHHDDVLAQLREAGPVHELLPGFFYVTRAHEIVEICKQPNVFQSDHLH